MTHNPIKLYLAGLVIGLIGAGIIIGTVQLSKPSSDNSFTLDKTKFASWQTVTTKTGLVSARFPTAPTQQNITVPINDSDYSMNQETYTSQDGDGVTYFLSIASYPEPFDIEKSNLILQTSLEGMLKAVTGNQLVESSYETYKNTPSVEFLIQNDTLYYRGKLFLKDNTLYQAFVSYTDAALHNDAYVYFLDSITTKLP